MAVLGALRPRAIAATVLAAGILLTGPTNRVDASPGNDVIKFEVELTLEHDGRFNGDVALVGVVGKSLADEASHCITDRKMRLRKQRFRGKTRSDELGHFEFKKRNGHGRFYAVAPKKVAQEGDTKVVCLWARSPNVRRD